MNRTSTPEQFSRDRTPAHRRFLRRVKSVILTPEFLYRLSLKMKYGAAMLSQIPGPNIANGTLKTRAEWEAATTRAKELHVPLHRGPEKNWDHLAAVSTILAQTGSNARILDAGAEIYSNVLPALFLYGYRDLHGINLSFTAPTRRGPIRYIPGDLTRTPYPDGFFDAITCMSVIEHGVPLDDYFREMWRLLKPGGLLITSTDYYPTPIDTRGQSVHGAADQDFLASGDRSDARIGEVDGLRADRSAGSEIAKRSQFGGSSSVWTTPSSCSPCASQCCQLR